VLSAGGAISITEQQLPQRIYAKILFILKFFWLFQASEEPLLILVGPNSALVCALLYSGLFTLAYMLNIRHSLGRV